MGGHTSLALDSNGKPCISYSYTGLYYAHKDNDGVWHTVTVDSDSYSGEYSSLALDSNGKPCISYYERNNGSLKYAYEDSVGVWHTVTVENAGNVGKHTSLALDSNGKPCISYSDISNGDLKYAYEDSDGVWHTVTVDSVGDVGSFTSLALDNNGTLGISYYDDTNDDLKYAELHPDISGHTSIDMGSIKQDEMKTEAFTITNIGVASLTIDGFHSSSDHFTVIEDMEGTVIYPGESKDFTVKFTPTDIGPYSAEIEVQSNDPDNVIINVSAEATYSDSNADLAGLTVEGGTLDLGFAPRTVSYAVDGIGDVSSIDITATLHDATATMTINGEEAQSAVAQSVNLEQGANLIPIVVTASDGVTQKAYILSINGTVSNADLSSLTVSEGTLSFDKDTTQYYVNVGNDTESIDVSAASSDSNALVLLNGSVTTSSAIELNVGENAINIMVVAQDASTKTYTVTVNRGTGDVNLSDISLSQGTLSPSFNIAVTEYTATVPYAAEDIIVSPTLVDIQASVTVNGNDPSEPVSLNVGENAIHIVVMGIDGVSQKTYTVVVTRKEALTINNETLPIGIVGGTYQATLSAEGGTLPYTWSSISTLPGDFTLNADGTITGTPAIADTGTYPVEVTVTDAALVTATKTYTLKINEGCGNGGYTIVSDGDSAYTGSYNDDGIPTLTVNNGVSGFTYFRMNISTVTGHAGNEVCLLVQMRNGVQIGFSFVEADFDTVSTAGAAFNVMAGDIIKVYIVDSQPNDETANPNVL